jgi:formamidopyrimidine-DNA glycosylase
VPELPDVVVYVEALNERVAGQSLTRALIRGPFLLRSVAPPIDVLVGRAAVAVRRVGKRIALGFEGGLWMVVHLMIAGRLHWRPAGLKTGSKNILAVFEFGPDSLVLTEAGSQHRASLHLVEGEAALASFSAGGLEVLEADATRFIAALRSENHTLKRSLTDPRLFSGIGNAYSDEILHRAQLSPVALSGRLSDQEAERLFEAARATLEDWSARLRTQAAGRFPEKVTAFREGMAVHGRFGRPCPRCGTSVQRIRYASNETDYCPACQTGGKLLADRGLSRLLREDWPRSLDELDALKRR